MQEENGMGKNSTDVILSVRNISKSFPGVKALDDVSLDIKYGVVHGIVGENGAGKSTLMKILSGVYTKDAGTILFDGEKIEKTTPMESLKKGLSIIYQEFSLINSMSVGENIFLGRFKEAGGMKGTHQKAKKLLEQIGSSINTKSFVSELSTSEKQMVEIAKALSFQSKLIIMDEPSSSLTEDELAKLGVIIRQLRERGISIIYISHKLDEIFEYCNYVTVMRDGHVIDTRPVEQLTRREMVGMMVGRTIENEYPERPHCVGGPLMKVEHLNTRKLHDISFTLNQGEILGLVGLVGAGRTEIVRALYGADKAKRKKIEMQGRRSFCRHTGRRSDGTAECAGCCQLRSSNPGKSAFYDIWSQRSIQRGRIAVYGRRYSAYVPSEFSYHAVSRDRIRKSRVCTGIFYSFLCHDVFASYFSDKNEDGKGSLPDGS